MKTPRYIYQDRINLILTLIANKDFRPPRKYTLKEIGYLVGLTTTSIWKLKKQNYERPSNKICK